MFVPQPLSEKTANLILDLANFMMGLNADQIAKNTSNCVYRISNSTLVDVPRYIYNMTALVIKYFIPYMIPMSPLATPANQALATSTFSLYTTVLI
jgi:hypothetical protein